ncbi:hypothetical protein QBC38DRAFT_488475 [Podospora fimiseda]|uniref:C2H2-type domain-containing protein n=1 Tax=Podospora fimiseda TaxID=252190 RepID=A0AAN7GWA7_9PEZI|nr:hypothetical protein QBC38DRAFT_488475 [Podospora fimiseda]
MFAPRLCIDRPTCSCFVCEQTSPPSTVTSDCQEAILNPWVWYYQHNQLLPLAASQSWLQHGHSYHANNYFAPNMQAGPTAPFAPSSGFMPSHNTTSQHSADDFANCVTSDSLLPLVTQIQTPIDLPFNQPLRFETATHNVDCQPLNLPGEHGTLPEISVQSCRTASPLQHQLWSPLVPSCIQAQGSCNTHVCSICPGSTFSSKKDLRQHNDTVHEGTRSWACSACWKAYGTNSNCHRHIRGSKGCRDSGGKPFNLMS